MTPRERFLAALRGGAVDRVPIELPGLQFSSRGDIAAHRDPLRRALAERIHHETVFRVEHPTCANRFLMTPPQRMRTTGKALPGGVRETAGQIDTPKGPLTFVRRWDPASQTDWMMKYPVESREDIDRIASIEWERPDELVPPGGFSPPEEFAARGVRAVNLSSPVVCVSGMIKYESFLELCITDLPLVKELTAICLRRVLDVLDVVLSRPGIELVWLGGSEWVTPPMAPPLVYDELVQEQERAIISRIHAAGALVHLHCHGRIRRALSRMIERGADYTEPVEAPPDGDVTMAEAKSLAAGLITLGGNVECRVLCNEDESAVEAATRAAFEGGSRRFVLRPSESPSPVIAEREFRNWMRMIDVWEEMSPV